MAEQEPQEPEQPEQVLNGMILRGPDGAVYLLSEQHLAEHRVPDDLAAQLAEVYGGDEVSGFMSPTSFGQSSFQIIASGPVIRKLGAPTASGWFDQWYIRDPNSPAGPDAR